MEYDDEYFESKRIAHDKWVKEKSIKLELGKVYLQVSASWAKMHYKIVSIDGKVALGKIVYCGIYNSKIKGSVGEYDMFYTATGQRYKDSRLNYALIEEVKENN